MIDIVNPCGEKAGIETSGVEVNFRNGFVGQRVGFLGNGKSNVEGLFSKWAELTLDEGAVDTLTLMKEGPMAKGGVERYHRLKENADIVFVGVCDGGTAASQGYPLAQQC